MTAKWLQSLALIRMQIATYAAFFETCRNNTWRSFADTVHLGADNYLLAHTKHVFWDGNFHNITSELAWCVLGINARRALKHLQTTKSAELRNKLSLTVNITYIIYLMTSQSAQLPSPTRAAICWKTLKHTSHTVRKNEHRFTCLQLMQGKFSKLYIFLYNM